MSSDSSRIYLELQALVKTKPDLSTTFSEPETLIWIGRVSAILDELPNRVEALEFGLKAQNLEKKLYACRKYPGNGRNFVSCSC